MSCNSGKISPAPPASVIAENLPPKAMPILTGAERVGECLPYLEGKRVAALVNHTSLIGKTHFIDSLLKRGVHFQKIFAPEHGFRGLADAGEHVKDGKDPTTGVPLISLYGDKKKPSATDLADVDIVVFDIQEVGARFYTYISTLSYLMEACAENEKKLLVLDRPNPNGHYVDGPGMKKSHASFVGLHEVPIVHGMTVGEYAGMVNGEGWLPNGLRCDLLVIPCENYDHQTVYELPVKPSPNLPNMRSIYLYPSICLFEGTVLSVGRGTDKQFQVLGAPGFPFDFAFTPQPMPGAKNPPQEGKLCKGIDLTLKDPLALRNAARIDLSYLLDFYQKSPDKGSFFLKNLFFDKLAGGTELRTQIVDGWSEEEIRTSWQADLEKFRAVRKKYLLYAE